MGEPVAEHVEVKDELGEFYRPNVDREYTPSRGLVFDSEESAYDFYNNYGRLGGFSIRRDYVTKSRKDQVIINRRFVCSKQGFRAEDKRGSQVTKHRRDKRTNCGAYLYISLDRATNKFSITQFEERHNHLLHKPDFAHMLSSQRRSSNAQASSAGEVGDTGKATHDLTSPQIEGREPLAVSMEDLRGYLHGRRQRDLEYGEAGVLLRYLEGKSTKNPFFFHSVQLDSAELVTNVFWADREMILDYGNFGDVVSFDTSFRTVKKTRPFACFVGFNHFKETVVFGSALLYDDTAESFEWLFETFLRAMSGKKPVTFFTEQDPAVASALAKVMPDVHHGLCTCQIIQNARKHFSHLGSEYPQFSNDFGACIYGYEDEHELVEAWEMLLDKYSLRENLWMKKIWELRHKWAHFYMRWTFTAGIQTTQLSESLNKRLRGCLSSDHNIIEFFTHFDRVVEETRYNERKCIFDSREKLPKLKMKSLMLVKASRTYTHPIFVLFQDEFETSLICQVKQGDELEGQLSFLVGEYGKDKRFTVFSNDVEQTVRCVCRKFEHFGILCSHALKVLDRMDIIELPDKYILQRWRLDAKDCSLPGTIADVNEDDPMLVVPTRYRTLCPRVVGLVACASEHKGAFQYLSNIVDEACKQVKLIKDSEGENELKLEREIEDATAESNLTQVKGLKKDGSQEGGGRVKPWYEKISKKRKKDGGSQLSNIDQSTHQSREAIDIQTSGLQSDGFNFPHGFNYLHGYRPILPQSIDLSSPNSNPPQFAEGMQLNGAQNPAMGATSVLDENSYNFLGNMFRPPPQNTE